LVTLGIVLGLPVHSSGLDIRHPPIMKRIASPPVKERRDEQDGRNRGCPPGRSHRRD
jgi:hypothetical protein